MSRLAVYADERHALNEQRIYIKKSRSRNHNHIFCLQWFYYKVPQDRLDVMLENREEIQATGISHSEQLVSVNHGRLP